MSLSKVLDIGGRALRFAPLPFRQLDALKDEIDLLMTPSGANFAHSDSRAAIVRVALASLKVHQPDITEDFLLDELNTFNFPLVINAVFDRNGFLADDAEPAQGEVPAAASPT